MNPIQLFILLIATFLFSCTKSKDESPAPATTPDYNWYVGKAASSNDTLKVGNGYLYYSAEGLNNSSATEQFSMAWAKGGLDGDFEMNIQYEALESDTNGMNLPFTFSLFPDGNISKMVSVNLGTDVTMIQYGNGSSSAMPSYDTKISTSGAVTVKRSGADFSVSITKNYSNNGVPAQYVQQSDSLNWFADHANFSFMVINSLSSKRAQINWTSFSVKNASGTLVESFDQDNIHR